MKLRHKKRKETSATIAPALWLVLVSSSLFILTTYASAPSWWATPGNTGTPSAVMAKQVVTNSGVVTTNYVPNNYAVVTQGQVKQFTVRAFDELNASLPGGAGAPLSNLVASWAQDYATNGYATNTANPTRPYKPSDFNAMNVGQLKYVGNMVWAQLVNAGYTNAIPSWLAQNTSTDHVAANLGQLKEVFNFDLSGDFNTITNLTGTLNSDGSVTLNWTVPSGGGGTITIAGEDANGNWTTITTESGTSTSATLSSSQTSGYVSLSVSNAQINPSSSLSQSSITNPNGPPSPPAIVSATLGANNSVNLAWSESNANGVTGFTIQQSTNQGTSWATVDSVGSGTMNVTLSNLPGAMDTSEFQVIANASSSPTSSAVTPVGDPTKDTDSDGTKDNLDGWAGFTDPTQEAKLAPPRLPNPSYAAVTISTIPNTYTIDFVNAQGQAVVDDGLGGYYFWDKGATTPIALPTTVSAPANSSSWGSFTVSNDYPNLQPTGLADDGTVIGYVDMTAQEPTTLTEVWCRQAWYWTKTMTQVTLLADLDSLDDIAPESDDPYDNGTRFLVDGWLDFATQPVSITSVNGVDTIYAYHQQYGITSGYESGPYEGLPSAPMAPKSYTEVYSSIGNYQPTYYNQPNTTDQTDWNFATEYDFGLVTYLQPLGTISQTGSHESRVPTQDNGNGTVIGTGAQMDSYQGTNGEYGVTMQWSFDANVVIPPTDPNVGWGETEAQSFAGLALEPQPSPQSGMTSAQPGGGMIVNNGTRYWINGAPTTVNSTGYVLGMQNSTSPANPTVNTGYGAEYAEYSPTPYFSYTDTNNVPVPAIWAPQTNNAGVATSYAPVGITMPQSGMSFQGNTGFYVNTPQGTLQANSGLFFNKNLQIAGGYKGDPNAFANEDVPFLWQNYQYHKLDDFFPGITNYSSFHVADLDDNGTITAIATPTTSNTIQQVMQLIPMQLVSDLNGDGKIDSSDISLEVKALSPSATDDDKKDGTEYLFPDDNISHGIWSENDPNAPTGTAIDDNAKQLQIACGAAFGSVWFEHPGITNLAFYKTRACLMADKITFPLALSSTNSMLTTLYVRVEGTVAAETDGNLVMKLGTANKTQTFAQVSMPLDIVTGFGDAHFFQAANRYILQNNSKHYFGIKTYSSDPIDIVVRNENYSTMKAFDAYWSPPSVSGTQGVLNPPLYGIKQVMNAYSTMDEVINGNFVDSQSVVGSSIEDNAISTKCLGNLMTGGFWDANVSETTNSGGFLNGPNSRYIAMNSSSPPRFTFGVGIAPTSGYQEAMGGLGPTAAGATNTLSTPDAVNLIGEAQVDSQNRVLFTLDDAALPADLNGVGGTENSSIVSDAIASGCAPLMGSTNEKKLFYTDGNTSMGLTLQDPNNNPQPLIRQPKQLLGEPYFVNTYLIFDSTKPRP